MKKVLLLTLLVISGVSMKAQNEIENDKFTTEVNAVVKNPNKASSGVWFVVNNEKEGATTITWQGNTGDKAYPYAMKFDNREADKDLSWYKAFVGQRITKALEKTVYNLTFFVRANQSNASISAYIKQSVEEKSDNGKYNTTFFVRDQYDAQSQKKSSAAQYNYNVKHADKWTKVSVDFDLSQLVNTVNSQSSTPDLQITTTPDHAAILKDCYIAILSQTKGAVVEISQVTFQKKK